MAGLKCAPDRPPSAYAIVRTVRPNASATPAKPIPRPGKAAASTALPHPPSTSQKVPTISTIDRLPRELQSLLGWLQECEANEARGRSVADVGIRVTRGAGVE